MVSRTNGKPDSFHRNDEQLTGRNSVCLFQFLFSSPWDTSPVWKHRGGSVEYAMITKTAESPQYFCCFVHWTPTLHRSVVCYSGSDCVSSLAAKMGGGGEKAPPPSSSSSTYGLRPAWWGRTEGELTSPHLSLLAPSPQVFGAHCYRQ